MSTPALAFDSTTFRRTLGMFATGITVITARASDGSLIGLTVNSFNSVSLDPPLIVWSLGNSSGARAALEQCEYYAVNVLAVDQQALSNLFASKVADRFADVLWEPGLGGAPLLAGCCAVFEVRNRQRIAGGDHQIFIGEVERCERSEREPLLYFNGAYRTLAGG
ncbi:MAG: nitrilotriacetate monooxygenase [Candidatus Dactylopiibacterium carminicum]|uniref:Flavin reductase n=1 Tax=Candidatus Dactylopiibacterium carminicum TaxID=857335 RepID=A0A272ET97_9RHOO|nr:flavin reductase family protein [Candidatus Dactylopiibacterium carminicum]KAF7599328.1 flavin reductase [Candidatus Dactylopiibacterium carminicum]PAS93329.1 MAG: nitrilotriacetate monooxygenase [Candidatus Dactylopiibacterium carminicum]PAS94341.1 MAG: nitrilotriacetate monooxygenase [Candidatus Dactylopiibacterium carminicum]PAS99331.1 MAG: nitrilotriacetate monooxygenase [Candidatus Dactylopiibacterium carminicum]